MAQILVRGLAPETVARLKKRAKERGRSLQSEVKGILEQAAKMDAAAFKELATRIRRSIKSDHLFDSTAIIREDRGR